VLEIMWGDLLGVCEGGVHNLYYIKYIV